MYKVAARFSLKSSSYLNGFSLKKSILSTNRHISNTPEFTVDHLVIGGGVVGLAVAERLSRHSKSSTILVEKNSRIGEETSSRNSEVIHAGLYYPEDSLKTSLCIRGKNMLYDFCKEYSVPHSQITKWVVAKNEEQAEYLIRLEEKAKRLNVPVEFISLKDRERLEPAVRAKEALVSPTTGIVDSHGLMERLEWLITENGADIACMTSVEGISKSDNDQGYLVKLNTDGDESYVLAKTVVNCAGLWADRIASMVMDQHSDNLKKLKIYYVKGHYYGYRGSPKVSRLIYPCPEKNLAGLGTHLTVDLAGKMKFGPDVKYINDPNDYHIEEGERLDDFLNAIREYLPEVKQEGLYADYAGIRPKLQAPGDPFRDFVIREESDNNLPGFVNCVGIESPGLTSSLAIGEMVETILYGKPN